MNRKGEKITHPTQRNGQTLEEVNTYKYFGKLISKKNNTEAHIEAIDTQIRTATRSIITETGNKEFKGLKCKPSGSYLTPQW